MSQGRVQRAIILAAGLGTRMLPLTKSIPKEMLPLGRKPLLHHVLEEVAGAGIRQVCIVTREGKEALQHYFLAPPACLAVSHPSLEELADLTARVHITFIQQRPPWGIANAVLAARHLVEGQPFLLVFPDQLVLGAESASLQLLRAYRPELGGVWSSLVRVDKAERKHFAGTTGFDFDPLEGGVVRVKGLLTEDETLASSQGCPYEVRGLGRTIVDPRVLDFLADAVTREKDGDRAFRVAFRASAAELPHYGVLLEGRPCDVGTFAGYYRYAALAWETSLGGRE